MLCTVSLRMTFCMSPRTHGVNSAQRARLNSCVSIRLDGGLAPEVLVKQFAELPVALGEHLESGRIHTVVTASPIHEGGSQNSAREAFRLAKLAPQSGPVIGILGVTLGAYKRDRP